MTGSAAHGRISLLLSGQRLERADGCPSGTASCARHRRTVVFTVLLGVTAWVHGAAQTATTRPIRAEFRSSPRSLVTQTIDRGRMVRTRGAVGRVVATAQDLGARDPAATMEHIQLVLQRPQERQAAFDAQVEALHQYGSPNYHQWLTPETVGVEFGPAASDLATLTGYLQAEGFTVNEVGKSGMFVDFTGTVEQVQQSFHTEIHNLRLPNGEEHYSAVVDAELPEALAQLVVGFVSAERYLAGASKLPLAGSACRAGSGCQGGGSFAAG